MEELDFYRIPNAEKETIFTQVSTLTGIPPYAVEKDWWVTQILDILFQFENSKHFVFKGGTSLSKGWSLIERFSEDIDLAIDRNYFGYGGDLNSKEIEMLRKKAGKFVENEFLPFLQKNVKDRDLESQIEIEPGVRSDRDRAILLSYPHVTTSPGYVEHRVKIEFSCRSLMEPASIREISSLIDQSFPDRNFAKPPIKIPTVNPERTFLEKLFLLHEEFQRPIERIRRGERLSRHLYDVVTLGKTEFATNALSGPELYQMIVNHRRRFNTISGINYNLHQPKTLNPIPVPEVLADWEKDYATMREEMIYEKQPPTFELLIKELEGVKEKINSVTWSIDESIFSNDE